LLQVDGLLKPDTVSTLLAHITQCLVDARSAADETPQGQRFFANVRQPVNGAGDHVRCDLKLELLPPVVAAVTEALAPLKAVHIATLGASAELFELGALISDPSALRQCVHADTGYTSDPIACSTFIALQDIDEDMGPTVFIPTTHQEAEAHVALQAREPTPGSYSSMTDRERLLQGSPNHVAALSSGDAIMFDSRLLHCGTANTSVRRRVIFYFSFRAKGGELGRRAAEATPTSGTLLEGATWGTSLLGTKEHT
jgi:ectoine hydroxylase-related dioxygenase (phytanoyl-CoA dioxygenase family)